MAHFSSQPPSKKVDPVKKFFRGGMMPASPKDVAALIVIDIRSLNLSVKEGKEIEASIRDFVFEQLEKKRALKDRTAIDLSSSVFGIAID